MMNDTSRQILSIKTLFKQKQGIKYTLFKFPKSLNNGLNRSFLYEFSLLSRTFPDSPKIFSIKIPDSPEISRRSSLPDNWKSGSATINYQNN